MKYIIDGFLIVEGKSDIAFLSSFLDCEILKVSGYVIPDDVINYANKLKSRYKPLILCDKDSAGEIISKRIFSKIDGSIIINSNKPLGKHNKFGIAESNKNDILELLKPYIISKRKYEELFSVSKFIIDVPNIFYSKIKNYYSLGNCSTKNMVKKLNYLGISLSEVKLRLGINDGNK